MTEKLNRLSVKNGETVSCLTDEHFEQPGLECGEYWKQRVQRFGSLTEVEDIRKSNK